MLDAFTKLRNPSYSPGHWGIASASGRWNYGSAKTRFIFDQLMQAQREGKLPAKPISCESGFNAGSSAVVYLDAMPIGSRHYEFSWGSEPRWRKISPYELQNSAMFKSAFGSSFTYVDGDTNMSIRKFALSNPDVKCDVIFVDGAKGTRPRILDIEMFRSISKPGAMMFGDEADTVSCVSGTVGSDGKPVGCTGSFGGTANAYHGLVRSGFLRYEACSPQARTHKDLVCLWSFLK